MDIQLQEFSSKSPNEFSNQNLIKALEFDDVPLAFVTSMLQFVNNRCMVVDENLLVHFINPAFYNFLLSFDDNNSYIDINYRQIPFLSQMDLEIHFKSTDTNKFDVNEEDLKYQYNCVLNNWNNKKYLIVIFSESFLSNEIQNTINSKIIEPQTKESSEQLLLKITSQQETIKKLKAEFNRAHQAESKYRNLFLYAPVGIFKLSVENMHLDANMAFSNLLGYRDTEELISHFDNLLDDLFVNQIEREKVIEEVFNGITFNRRTVLLRRKDSTTFLAEISVRITQDENNNPTFIEGLLTDVSEKQFKEVSLESHQNLFLQIVQTSPDAILITGEDNLITYASPRVNQIFGFPENTPHKDRDFFSLFSKENVEKVRENIQYISDFGFEKESVFHLKKADESVFYGEIHSTLMVNKQSGTKHILSVIHDITFLKEREFQLFEAMQKAEEADKLKSSFLSNISHEVRTPMNGILGFSELIDDPDINEEKRSEYIQIIKKSGNRLLSIIDNIVELAKVETKQIKINETRCNLNHLMRSTHTIVENRRYLEEKDHLKVILETGLEDQNCKIHADSGRLQQVLVNLIVNGLKFTNAGTVTFGYRLKNTNQIEFYVADTGIGIAKDKFDVIFERFRQIDESVTRKYGGVGIGLSLSKGIVELMGGQISVESEVGVGTTFRFTIPYKPIDVVPQELGIIIDSLRNYSWPDKNILVVEDDDASFKFFSEIFSHAKVNVFRAENGKLAVEACRRYKDLHLILMDMQLPLLNGYDATIEIRKFNTQVPIIAQTANALHGDRDKYILAGCNEYISKPIDPQYLFQLINKYITQELG